MILERLKEYIDLKSITVAAFERSVGMSNGSFGKALKNCGAIGTDKLENILSVYSDLSIEWLLTGNGLMLKRPSDYPSVPENQPEMTASEPFEPRSNAVQTPIRRETRQQKADPSPDVIMSLLDTIRQQAEEIGMLKERLRASEEERERLAEAAHSPGIADAE